jgi:serine/threonine protein kinase
MPEGNARMLVAQLALAINHIHQLHHIYLALCHDHVMFDARGFLRLIGLGNCQRVAGPTATAQPHERQPVGVPPYYFSPEVMPSVGGGIAGGHTQAADYWMLGCFMVDILTGQGPFGDYDDSPVLVEARVREHRLMLSSHLSRHARSLAEGLLALNPDLRIKSLQEIRDHRWMAGFDWAALQECNAPVMVDPCVEHPGDAINFPSLPPAERMAEEKDAHGVLEGTLAAASGGAGGSPLKSRASHLSQGGPGMSEGGHFMRAKSSHSASASEKSGGWVLDLAKRHRAPDHEREAAKGPDANLSKEERETAKALLSEL